MDKRKAGRKAGKKTVTVDLDRELYDFFKEFAAKERDTMAGLIRKHILSLKRQDALTSSSAQA